MAQRTEKEETEFKVPETLTLCANNCGVIGNPATNNMCQKCFNATSSSSSSSASSSTPTTSAVASGASSVLNFSGEKSTRSSSSRSPERTGSSIRKQAKASTQPVADSTARTEVNRCSGCRRKVGLTGFRCRCGELFCADHRYSDRHDCSYDYKAAGREAIARENPVVRASKIVRV